MKASGKNKKLFRSLTEKQTTEDVIFNVISTVIVSLICIAIIYPLYFIVIASISNPDFVLAGEVFLWPKDISFDGYQRILNYDQLWIGYRNSIFYAVCGALLSSTVTIFAAYPLSRPDFSGGKAITIFILITMFFHGGLIPTYNLVKSLGLRNTPFVLLLVNGISVMNVFIARSYLKSSSIDSLYEAAQIDGSSHIGYFFRVLIPI